jgi:hypothetical protein
MTDTIIEGSATEVKPDASASSTGNAKPPQRRRRAWLAAVAAPLALGAVALTLLPGTETTLTPVTPTAIASLAPSGAIAARGEITDIFGSKFLVQDGTGRALVETGREGRGGTLVRTGDTVTVQGRFEEGVLRARLLTRADGSRLALGPAGAPPPGTLSWAADKIGLVPKPDLAGLTAIVQAAGYADLRVTGRGPRHLEIAARGQDGREHLLHVGFDGQVRDRRVL